MADNVTFDEMTEGQSFVSTGETSTATKVWSCTGAVSPLDVLLATNKPVSIGDAYTDDDLALTLNLTCSRTEITPPSDVDSVYFLTATYDVGKKNERPDSPADGDEYHTFESAGEYVHIEQANAQSQYPTGVGGVPDAKDYGKTIGVGRDNSVAGVDVLDSSEILTVTKFKSEANYTPAFINGVRDIRNTIYEDGANTWYGTTKQEALFTGMRKVAVRSGIVELEFTFKISQTKTQAEMSKVIGKDGNPITVTGGKLGWQYFWVQNVEGKKGAGVKAVTYASGVYIADVYPTDTFASLGLSGVQ